MSHWLPRPLLHGPLRAWLTASGSLSERLRNACTAGFRVQRLSQGRRNTWCDERAALCLPASDNHGQPMVREVLLCCGDTPVIFARSIAATAHLDGPWRSLRGLGARPLATMLFADPRISRGELSYCRLDARSPLYRRAALAVADLPSDLWARRSVFCQRGSPLLVTEVFLPGVLTL
jgi:chorismate--pyruvate lyase